MSRPALATTKSLIICFSYSAGNGCLDDRASLVPLHPRTCVRAKQDTKDPPKPFSSRSSSQISTLTPSSPRTALQYGHLAFASPYVTRTHPNPTSRVKRLDYDRPSVTSYTLSTIDSRLPLHVLKTLALKLKSCTSFGQRMRFPHRHLVEDHLNGQA